MTNDDKMYHGTHTPIYVTMTKFVCGVCGEPCWIANYLDEKYHGRGQSGYKWTEIGYFNAYQMSRDASYREDTKLLASQSWWMTPIRNDYIPF